MAYVLFIISFLVGRGAEAGSIDISFHEKNLSDRGELIYILFSKDDGFPDRPEKGFLRGRLEATRHHSPLRLDHIPDGTYAFSIIHDENANGELDKNFFGLPKESFGFSNNPRIFLGPPGFKRAAFEVKGETKLQIEMKRL